MRSSGECVYHQSYNREKQNSDESTVDGTVMSSLLSTVEIFSTNVDQGGAKMLETANFRFIYHKNDDFIYVARTIRDADPDRINQVLTTVSTEMKSILPEKWDGNVSKFSTVGEILEKQFSRPELNQYYEITGRAVKRLDGIEAKIYSYLRFRGRAQLGHIAKIMKIPENEAVQVTSKLVHDQYLEACS
jgi:hypothetical protein